MKARLGKRVKAREEREWKRSTNGMPCKLLAMIFFVSINYNLLDHLPTD